MSDSAARPGSAPTGRATDPRLKWAVAAAVVLLLALIVRSTDPFGWFDAQDTRTAATASDVTLIEIREAAELNVATGWFSVPVILDVSRTGLRDLLPEYVDRERIVAVYQGDVEAMIDLRGLTEDGITADPETRTITVRVPAPRLTEPRIDHGRSQILSHERGVLQRVEDAFGGGSVAVKEDLDRAAVAAIAKAAGDSDLTTTAQQNGTQFLTLLCQQLGYDQVTIEFLPAPR